MQPERNAIMTVTQGSTALQQPKRAESTCTVGTRDRYYTFSRPRLRARRPPFSDPGILQAFYKVHLCAETTETYGLNSLLTVLLQTGGTSWWLAGNCRYYALRAATSGAYLSYWTSHHSTSGLR